MSAKSRARGPCSRRGTTVHFINGTKKHLQRYVYEFVFRPYTKKLPAFDKSDSASRINYVDILVGGMEGKRLTHKEISG